ncbi:medium chain dehydrogenase/reductase family protein [Tenggerimyces flavus]|uniref:Medium chain dehydrogenase/reductase family protein n=1 Tax=Tenggerimyces flavus TaxID=1708749 RepID=A0ABV7YNJ7_9ACTN|nr:medium chain dehydrogenase/reductase family protein [Tenggerimyces flavus]MBM7784856.1 NADPH:quinone reductase-like Zn-dependent oxidoreductase [Tenggerimyces flavus]
MKATEVVLTSLGEPESLEFRRRDLPEPGADEALVRVEATGVSFAEQQMRRGRYPGVPPFPFVLGYDLIGVIESFGNGSDQHGDLRVGQRVGAIVKVGGWADRAIVHVGDLARVPDGVTAEQAEALALNGVTAYQLVHRVTKVRPGQTVLVQGATGGVGTILVQVARLAGAHVVGTASPAKHALVEKLGATPVDYRGDLPAKLREVAPDGFDAIFDHVGPSSMRALQPLLKPSGTIVSYGSHETLNASGSAYLPWVKMMLRGLLSNLLPGRGKWAMYNVMAGKAEVRRPQVKADFEAVLALAKSGELHGEIAATYPLDQAVEALKLAESGRVTGKILLLPGADESAR